MRIRLVIWQFKSGVTRTWRDTELGKRVTQKCEDSFFLKVFLKNFYLFMIVTERERERGAET